MNSNSSAELNPELLDDFYAECDEHLKSIRDALVRLESSVGKAQADVQVLEELFRNFHSFKGISAIVGLRAAEELAHAAEGFLRELSRGRASLTIKGLELLMEATQRLEQIVVGFRSGASHPPSETLQQALREQAGQDSKAESAGAAGAASAVTGEEIEAARARGAVLLRCSFTPSRELDLRGINISAVRARLGAIGEILRVTPQVRGEGSVAFELIVAGREVPADVAEWEAAGITVELIEGGGPPAAESATAEAAAAGAKPVSTPFISPSHVVRVDLKRLDELMRITGEMVIHRSRFEDQLALAARRRGTVPLETLQEINAALSRSLRELRQSILRVRLVPVAEIFARMPFVVRDLARDTAKQVRLKLEGQQTELDKYVIERLKDPLLHLVRNAFSHAVESPEERAAAGKPREATITLSASTRGDSVLIQVRDDGRGIDAKAVARRAAVLGIAVPQPFDLTALLQVLCSPGFSTREDADRAAGRGVGMAVVYNTVRELGGSIILETAPGRGTKFALRLPLTLAVTEAFIVSTGEQTCAIPQSFVREVTMVAEDQLRLINRVEMAPYQSGVLPVVRLSKMFNLPAAPRERSSMLVLTTERGSTGLIVDRIHGHREVVVSAIRDPLVQAPGIAGATELGDGRPVLILDGTFLTSGPVRPNAAPESAAAEAEA